MVSPPKERFSSLAPPSIPAIYAPPSPRSHRTLRRLNSAHTLGSNRPSLISQQLQQQTTRNQSPVCKDQSTATTAIHTHQRRRSNSDVVVMSASAMGSSARKQNNSKKVTGTESLSLDRLVREGPGGDLAGALETTRLKILDQGIKTDSDGMASLNTPECKRLC